MIKLLLLYSCVIFLRVRTTFAQNVFDCGVSQILIDEVIVNGYNTVRGAWPWHVAIHHKYGTKDFYACGGTLVTQYHVLTAAHCLKSAKNGKLLTIFDVFVRLGVYRLNSTDSSIQRRMIREIHKTDDFPRQDLRNDIAILQLATKVEFGQYVQPACVSLTKDLIGQLGVVIGWGVDESERVSYDLKSAQLPVVDYYTCLASNRAIFGAVLDEGVFCAGHTNGTSVCNGDSGGGLFFEENGAWHLGGIVSFSQFRKDGSKLCYSKGYSVFTKIHTYLPWIKSVTKLKYSIDEDQYDSEATNGNAYYANLLPRDCGINSVKGAVQQNLSNVFEFPWMAILRYKSQSEVDAECVGSLIHKRYVLTHAGCTYYETPYQVRLGEHTIGQSRDCTGERCAPPVRDYGIEYITIHPNVLNGDIDRLSTVPLTNSNIAYWLPIHLSHVTKDIALIRLIRDVTFEDHIRPVCLPVTQSLRSHAPDQYISTGWQVGPDYPSPSALLKVTAANNAQLCVGLQRDDNLSVDGLLCIVNLPDREVCKMSLASPLGSYVKYNGLRFVQFGVNMQDGDCKRTLSMSTAFHMDWILTNIKP